MKAEKYIRMDDSIERLAKLLTFSLLQNEKLVEVSLETRSHLLVEVVQEAQDL